MHVSEIDISRQRFRDFIAFHACLDCRFCRYPAAVYDKDIPKHLSVSIYTPFIKICTPLEESRGGRSLVSFLGTHKRGAVSTGTRTSRSGNQRIKADKIITALSLFKFR